MVLVIEVVVVTSAVVQVGVGVILVVVIVVVVEVELIHRVTKYLYVLHIYLHKWFAQMQAFNGNWS